MDQPAFTNHKAGWLGLGRDGFLYAALGDGGGAGDPLGSGQNVESLLGKILRLDVHADAFPADPTRNYAIPADNPFVGQLGADEIWALVCAIPGGRVSTVVGRALARPSRLSTRDCSTAASRRRQRLACWPRRAR